MKGCVKHLTLCFLEEFSWPSSSCCLVPPQEKQPSEMSKDQEPALLDSSPSSTLRGQVIYSFHQLLLQSQCLSPLKQERHPGVPCQFQWRFQWKNVYEGSVGNAVLSVLGQDYPYLLSTGDNLWVRRGHSSTHWPFQRVQLTSQPRKPTSRYSPRGMKACVHKRTSVWTFTADLVITAPNWKQPESGQSMT